MMNEASQNIATNRDSPTDYDDAFRYCEMKNIALISVKLMLAGLGLLSIGTAPLAFATGYKL
jgi:hypothetical protein